MKIPSFLKAVLSSRRAKITAILLCGVFVGGTGLCIYLLRAHTCLTDDPAACVNCHIMAPYYATWMHGSHSRGVTCNDCHVPHENAVKKWTFKGLDGMKHVPAFVTRAEDEVITAQAVSSRGGMSKK